MLCFCVLETFGGDSIIVIKLALHPVLLSILLTLKESKGMREEEGWSWIFTLLPSKSQAEMLLHSGHMSRSLNPPFYWIRLHFLLVFLYILGATATSLEHLDLLWRDALGCTVHKLRRLLCCQCCRLHIGQLLPWVVTGHLSWDYELHSANWTLFPGPSTSKKQRKDKRNRWGLLARAAVPCSACLPRFVVLNLWLYLRTRRELCEVPPSISDSECLHRGLHIVNLMP